MRIARYVLNSLPTELRNNSSYRRYTSFLRGVVQNRQLKQEYSLYQAKARKLGISQDADPAEAFETLVARAKTRGIVWPPEKTSTPIHSVLVCWDGGWELDSLPQALAELGEVSVINLNDFDIPKHSGNLTRELTHEILLREINRIHKLKAVTVIWSYLAGATVHGETLKSLSKLGIVLVGFNFDDKLSFRGRYDGKSFTGPAAVCNQYDLNLTSSPSSILKYKVEGANSIFWPEGASKQLYFPTNQKRDLDLVFLGARYGRRRALVEKLVAEGLSVTCFGQGWPNGFLPSSEVNSIYNRAKIVLGAGWIGDSNQVCLKARDFEVPMAGAAYLTTSNEELDKVYKVGEEILTYKDFDDCAFIAKNYLNNPSGLEKIRIHGHLAALERHQWRYRFEMVLNLTNHDFLTPFPKARIESARINPQFEPIP